MGVGESTLINHERRGLLHPQRAIRGQTLHEYVVYDPDELARLPQRYRKAVQNEPGEQNARAFEMFDQGKSVREVVITLREVTPKIVELHEQWLDAGGTALVISPAAHAELAKHVGPFGSVAELCERMKARKTIEADVPEHVTDAQVEIIVNDALDAAGAPR
jgi:hypothetical protein